MNQSKPDQFVAIIRINKEALKPSGYTRLSNNWSWDASTPAESFLSVYPGEERSHMHVNVRNIYQFVMKQMRESGDETDEDAIFCVIRIIIEADLSENNDVMVDCQINAQKGVHLVVEAYRISRLLYNHGGNPPKVIAGQICYLDADVSMSDIECNEINHTARGLSKKVKKISLKPSMKPKNAMKPSTKEEKVTRLFAMKRENVLSFAG